jgi:hypothetical protein
MTVHFKNALLVITAAFAAVFIWQTALAGGPGGDGYPAERIGERTFYGRHNQLWASDDGLCYAEVATISDQFNDIRDLTAVGAEAGVLLATTPGGLWVFQDGVAQPEPKDFLRGTLSSKRVLSLVMTDELIFVGIQPGFQHSAEVDCAALSDEQCALKRDVGLWIWERDRGDRGWRPATDDGFPSGIAVFDLEVSAFQPGVVFAGTHQAGIFQRSPEGGWSPMAQATTQSGKKLLSGVQVQVLEVGNDENRQVLYAGAGGTLPFRKGIFRYRIWTDDAHWEAAGGTAIPSNAAVWSIEADPDVAEGVWAGTERGLFYSSDSGDSWIQIRLPSSNPSVHSILATDRLTVFTDAGLFQADLSEARREAGQWKTGQFAASQQGCIQEPTLLPSSTRPPTSTSTKPAPTVTAQASATSVPTSTPAGIGDDVQKGFAGKLGGWLFAIFLAGLVIMGRIAWLMVRQKLSFSAAAGSTWSYAVEQIERLLGIDRPLKTEADSETEGPDEQNTDQSKEPGPVQDQDG